MRKKTISRKELIEYIKKNERYYSGASFDGRSLEQLVIKKTEIQMKIRKRKANQ